MYPETQRINRETADSDYLAKYYLRITDFNHTIDVHYRTEVAGPPENQPPADGYSGRVAAFDVPA
jgi:hypothetical protein